MVDLATRTPTVRPPDGAYWRRVRALGAWWCLGSSALDPRLLTEYAPEPLPMMREAGL